MDDKKKGKTKKQISGNRDRSLPRLSWTYDMAAKKNDGTESRNKGESDREIVQKCVEQLIEASKDHGGITFGHA